MSEAKVWDAIIVGAGAAGLMTAIQARRKGLSVLLVDGREKIGAKILMSGGTRCNLTNVVITEKDFETEQKKIVSSVLKSFSSKQAIEFFEKLGVASVIEPGGKYFPSTHSGRTVLEALVKEIERSGVRLVPGRKITKIFFERGIFTASGEGFSFRGKALVLTTGGLSFPSTGSDGTGYGLAKSFGHSLIRTSPSLTPLLTGDADLKKLSGVTMPVRLTFSEQGKKKVVCEDSFLFTHAGFSGPAALNISRHWIRADKKAKPEIAACFLPQEKEEGLRVRLFEAAEKNPSQLLKSFLGALLPQRFVEVIFAKFSIPLEVSLGQLKREHREKILRALFHFPLHVTGDLGYAKAEVTAGGVDLAEVHRLTLESKKQPGLFFAGEILDVDGRIGGFNFQWAWSSGVVAAAGVARYAALCSSS